MEAELEVLCMCKPDILKGGGELTTEQQTELQQEYGIKCTTRPLRKGRAKEYPEQDSSEWRELTCHGHVRNIEAAHLKAAIHGARLQHLRSSHRGGGRTIPPGGGGGPGGLRTYIYIYI